MKCPICESPLRPGADRCPDCGYRIPHAQAAAAAQEPRPRSAYTPPVRKKRSGCCCCLAAMLPFLIVLILSLVSFGSLVLEEIETAIPEPGFFSDAPYEDEPSVELDPEDRPAPADEGCFAIVEGTLMFLPEHWSGGPVLSIPGTIGGQQVRTIGPGCFENCTDLTTIVLPDSVTAIAPRAFAGCTALRGLYLPDGVVSVGQDAFSGCTALEAVSVPTSVTHIAEHVFDDCASLLYIFYGGNFEDWDKLYDDYINPYTTAVCLDGYYYHGSEDEILTP